MLKNDREFKKDLGKAIRKSLFAPVIVTDRGKPKHLLLNYDNYLKLTHNQSKPKTLFDWFASADEAVAEIDLEIPKSSKTQRHTIKFE